MLWIQVFHGGEYWGTRDYTISCTIFLIINFDNFVQATLNSSGSNPRYDGLYQLEVGVG